MASLSSIHHAIARLQAVSASPLPPELICVGPLRCPLERKVQAYSLFKKPPVRTCIHSALRSKLLLLATTAGQDTATSTLVLQEVDFVWKGEGSQVLLTGDFLGWDSKLLLSKGPDGDFHCKQKLSPGTYKYKYIIDGEWAHSPDSPMIEDGKGGFNNQITVTEGSSASANIPNSKLAAEGASLTASTRGSADSSPAARGTANSPAAAKAITDVGGSPKAAAKPADDTTVTASAKGPIDSSPAAKGTANSPAATKASADVGGLPKAEAKASAEVGGSPKAAPKASTDVGGSLKAESKANTEVGVSPKVEAKASAEVGGSPKAAPKMSADVGGSPKATAKPSPGARPAKKAAVDKPYPQIIIEDVVPKIKANLQKEQDISDVNLVFQDNQLEGSFMKKGIIYTFWAFFPDGKLEGSRGFSLSSHGAPPSTVEPFLIDEKKITADLLVFWVMKRLFVQNLLSLN